MRTFLKAPLLLLAMFALLACSGGGTEENGIIETIDDLKGQKVAVNVGSSQDRFLEVNFPDITPFRVDGVYDVVAPILTGMVPASLTDGAMAKTIIEEDPRLAVTGGVVFDEDFGMPFKDDEVRMKFNAFLAGLRASGELDTIREKWENDEGDARMPDLDYPAPNGTLTIMTDFSMPLVFIKDGVLCGLDIELLSRFCAEYGYRPDFKTTNFSAALIAMSTGKTDAMCGGVTITPERAARISFSDPYYISHSTLLVRKDRAPGGNDAGRSTSIWAHIKKSFYDNLVKEDRYLIIVNGLKTTIIVSVFSILLGSLLGIVVCFLRMNRSKVLRTTAKTFIEIMRGIPQVVLLMLMFYVVFASSNLDGVIVAIITFSINLAAYASEIFRTAIESIDRGQTEAGVALGFSKVQTFFHIIAPQAVRRALPVYKGEVVSLVKMTSIIGYIAVQDLTKASDIIRSRTFDAFFPLLFVAAIYFLLAYLLTLLLTLVEKKYERNH